MSGYWSRSLKPLPSYIPLFPDAYWAGTRQLSLEEQGAHLNLMMHAWLTPTCDLPDDDHRLARILGITAGRWRKLKPAVMDLWHLNNGRWIQNRLTRERAAIEARRLQAAAAANMRWNKASR